MESSSCTEREKTGELSGWLVGALRLRAGPRVPAALSGMQCFSAEARNPEGKSGGGGGGASEGEFRAQLCS